MTTLARVHGPVEDFQSSDLVTFDVIGDVFATRDDSLYRAARVQMYGPIHRGDVWVCLIHQTSTGDSDVIEDDVWVTLRTLRAGSDEYGPIGRTLLEELHATDEAWTA